MSADDWRVALISTVTALCVFLVTSGKLAAVIKRFTVWLEKRLHCRNEGHQWIYHRDNNICTHCGKAQ